MKSLTKINGANHASGYKSVAKFAQGLRGEDGLRPRMGVSAVPHEAGRYVVDMIAQLSRAIETADMEKRLTAIEDKIKKSRDLP